MVPDAFIENNGDPQVQTSDQRIRWIGNLSYGLKVTGEWWG